MKVLFTFGGIPHYLNAMLNRLQAKGVEITVVSSKNLISRLFLLLRNEEHCP
jgi:hypothetical protein